MRAERIFKIRKVEINRREHRVPRGSQRMDMLLYLCVLCVYAVSSSSAKSIIVVQGQNFRENLIFLSRLGGEVYIPEAVFVEVTIRGKGRPGSKEIAEAEWIYKKEVIDREDILASQIFCLVTIH